VEAVEGSLSNVIVCLDLDIGGIHLFA